MSTRESRCRHPGDGGHRICLPAGGLRLYTACCLWSISRLSRWRTPPCRTCWAKATRASRPSTPGQFNIVVEEEGPSSVYEEGEIYDQNPDPGLTVKEQSTISIKVSTGKQTVVLEDYCGTRLHRGVPRPQQQEPEVGGDRTYSNEYAAGTVVMTAPGAGEEVAEGDEISVYVSLGSQESEPDRAADCRHELSRSQNAADHPPAAHRAG